MRAFLLLLVLPITGCESCARGRGAPGAPPVEAIASAPPAASAPPIDPCRGPAIPEDQHFVANGLCARVLATKQGKLRQITFASNGVLFGVTVAGAIKRYEDRNGDGVYSADEIVEWAHTGDGNGHSVELDETAGYLYAGSKAGIRRWKWSKESLASAKGEDVMVGQPGGGNHPYHPVHIYDGVMYVDSGSDKNAIDPMPADYDTDRSVIKTFPLDKFVPGKPFEWKDGAIFVRGARNLTGFTRTRDGKIYGVLSGADDVRYRGVDIHPDNPGDSLVLLEKDHAYGFPFCAAAVRVVADGKVVPPGTLLAMDYSSQNPLASLNKSNKSDAWCREHATPPLTVFQAHTSSLSIAFFEGPDGALPARYRNGAFIALHGSWDRNPSTGNKIVFLPFDESGRPKMATSTATTTTFPYEVVFGGGKRGEHRDGAWGWSGEDVVRPVGVAISPVDGALYVSSDNGRVPLTDQGKGEGALYRIGIAK